MTDIHKTIEAVWKIESTRLIAAIARVTRDIGIAEELARFTEAREEIQRAISMTHNLREQELLTERLKQIEKASLSA